MPSSRRRRANVETGEGRLGSKMSTDERSRRQPSSALGVVLLANDTPPHPTVPCPYFIFTAPRSRSVSIGRPCYLRLAMYARLSTLAGLLLLGAVATTAAATAAQPEYDSVPLTSIQTL